MIMRIVMFFDASESGQFHVTFRLFDGASVRIGAPRYRFSLFWRRVDQNAATVHKI